MQDADQKSSYLLENEQEVSQVCLHPIIFLQPLLMYLASIYLFFQPIENMKYMGFFLLFAASGVAMYSLLRFKELRLILTNNRLLLRSGLFKTIYSGYFLDEIVEFEVQRSFLGKMLHFGNLWVELTTGRVNQLRAYAQLDEFAAKLKQQQELYYQTMMYKRAGAATAQSEKQNNAAMMQQST